MIIPLGVPHLAGYEVTQKTNIVRVAIDPAARAQTQMKEQPIAR